MRTTPDQSAPLDDSGIAKVGPWRFEVDSDRKSIRRIGPGLERDFCGSAPGCALVLDDYASAIEVLSDDNGIGHAAIRFYTDLGVMTFELEQASLTDGKETRREWVLRCEKVVESARP